MPETFSRRNGLVDPPPQMKLQELSEDIRIDIWNATLTLLQKITYRPGWMSGGGSPFFGEEQAEFVKHVVTSLKTTAVDEIDFAPESIRNRFKDLIRKGRYNLVLDFVELVSNYTGKINMTETDFGENPHVEWICAISTKFEENNAPYRLRRFRRTEQTGWKRHERDVYQFIPVSNGMQTEATEANLNKIERNEKTENARKHIENASTCLKAGQYPDSVGESAKAIEAIARDMAPGSHNHIKDALRSLEKTGRIQHQALSEAILRTYGYASDTPGARHARVQGKRQEANEQSALFMWSMAVATVAYIAGDLDIRLDLQQEQDT